MWCLEADGKGGEPVASLPGHTGWVRDIAIDEDGGVGGNLYSIGCNFIKVWEPARQGGGSDGNNGAGIDADDVSGAKRKEAAGGGKWGEGGLGEPRLVGDLRVEGDQLRVAYGGGYLFSAGIDGSLRAWRSPGRGNMGAPVKEVEGAHAGRVTGLAWADGHLYSCSHDGYVRYTIFHSRLQDSFHAISPFLSPCGYISQPPSRSISDYHPFEPRMWSGGGSGEEEVLSLVAEVDAKGYVGVYADEDERLMCMAISVRRPKSSSIRTNPHSSLFTPNSSTLEPQP